MWPHQGRVEGKDHLPGPPGHALFHEPQDTIGLRDHKGTPLTHGQPAVRQATSVLLCKAPFHPPTCTNACSYPYPGAGLYTGSYCLPACPGLPKWQHRLMVCQPLFKSEEGLFRGTYYSEHQTFLKISHYFLSRTVSHSFSWETYCECYGITEHMVTPRVSNDLKIYFGSIWTVLPAIVHFGHTSSLRIIVHLPQPLCLPYQLCNGSRCQQYITSTLMSPITVFSYKYLGKF